MQFSLKKNSKWFVCWAKKIDYLQKLQCKFCEKKTVRSLFSVFSVFWQRWRDPRAARGGGGWALGGRVQVGMGGQKTRKFQNQFCWNYAYFKCFYSFVTLERKSRRDKNVKLNGGKIILPTKAWNIMAAKCKGLYSNGVETYIRNCSIHFPCSNS